MKVNRRTAIAGIAAAVAASAGRADSPWPNHQIKWIVPFAAGGSTDAFSRLAAEQLSLSLGQPVIVDNETGASGAIGCERLARSAADGYTLGTIPNSLQTMLPYVSEVPLPYDPMKSFTPIGGFAQFQYVFVVSSSSRVKTLGDLISIGKNQPGKFTFGTTGNGTGNHLATVLLAQKTGANFTFVPYKGASQSVVDLLGGHIDLIVDIIGGVDALIREGKLRPLATTGAKRHPLLPDVPTVSETIPGYNHVGWFGLYGPAGLPPEMVNRLNADLQRAQASQKYSDALAKLGYEPMPGSSADLAAQQQREYEQWGAILKKRS